MFSHLVAEQNSNKDLPSSVSGVLNFFPAKINGRNFPSCPPLVVKVCSSLFCRSMGTVPRIKRQGNLKRSDSNECKAVKADMDSSSNEVLDLPVRSTRSRKGQGNSKKSRSNTIKAVQAEMDCSSTEVQGADLDKDELEDEIYDNEESTLEKDPFIDEMLVEEGEGGQDIILGDGGDGGGINLGQTKWGERALALAKDVLQEFGSNFSLYAFKVSPEGYVYVRLDKLSDKFGSPSMVEIESFSTIYGRYLEEAGQKGGVPDNLGLEVSSPGAERVVEVPGGLLRFKDLPMFVRYIEKISDQGSEGSAAEKDAVLELESLQIESGKSVWKLANVRLNRELAGKGRGLNKKQKEWRTEVPLSSLRLVRLYLDM